MATKMTIKEKAMIAANKWYEKQGIPTSDRNMLSALSEMYERGFKSGKHHEFKSWAASFGETAEPPTITLTKYENGKTKCNEGRMES